MKAWPIWHAFTQELLAKTEMPNNDRDARRLKLIRTEHADVMAGVGGFGPDKTMNRGVLVAGSLMTPTSVGGTHFTEQIVPHHRVISTYLTDRNPGSRGQGFFKDDAENEVVFMPHGIPFDYKQSVAPPRGGGDTAASLFN